MDPSARSASRSRVVEAEWAAAAWRSGLTRPAADLDAFYGPHAPIDRAPRILGLFAHPDDEVFCCGGTIARCAEAGAVTAVASLTHGESGQIRDAAAATRRSLGTVRVKERCSRWSGRASTRRVRPPRSDDRACPGLWARLGGRARIARKPSAGGRGNCDPGPAHHVAVLLEPGPPGRGGNGQVDQKDLAARPGIVATTPMRLDKGRHDRREHRDASAIRAVSQTYPTSATGSRSRRCRGSVTTLRSLPPIPACECGRGCPDDAGEEAL